MKLWSVDGAVGLRVSHWEWRMWTQTQQKACRKQRQNIYLKNNCRNRRTERKTQQSLHKKPLIQAKLTRGWGEGGERWRRTGEGGELKKMRGRGKQWERGHGLQGWGGAGVDGTSGWERAHEHRRGWNKGQTAKTPHKTQKTQLQERAAPWHCGLICANYGVLSRRTAVLHPARPV